jgi:methyl-accepting chemotaxis protein
MFTMLQHLNRVFTRILLLAALALTLLIVTGFVIIHEGQSRLFEQKKNDIRHVVEAAVGIVADYDKRAAAGEMTREQAQEQAKRALNVIRYDGREYVFVFDASGVVLVNPAVPAMVGTNRFNLKDPNGRPYVQEMIETGKNGGGHVSYSFPKPPSTEPTPKISYTLAFQPWGWTVATGVWFADIDAAESEITQKAMIWLIGGGIVLLLGVFLLTRSIVKPVARLTQSLKRLAGGDIEAKVEGSDRGDEIGAIARAVEEVRATIRNQMTERMRSDDETKAHDQAARKADMHKLADEFQAAVGNIVQTVSSASSQLEAAASTLTQTAETTQRLSTTAAAASNEASANVNSVASASEQLTGSVNEIARQVGESSRIANEAVRQAQQTDARIATLSQAASRIGDVVKLITGVAEQTNLLALNATIEAARAGEAGKGFAVVAQEVKALAAQTAKATDEISTQIAGMQTATEESVAAIKEIGGTIARISEIASAIAAAVEEQGAATQEISRNVQQAAQGTAQVATNITDVNKGASQTGSASGQVLTSAQSLSRESNRLKVEVDKFLTTVRAA